MNKPFSQDNKVGKLHTALGKDHLVLLRFDGHSSIDDLFEFNVDALSHEPNIDFNALIGTHATVELDSMSGDKSFFDGVVTEAQWTGVEENGNTYKLVLRPWFWLATRRRNQRIFHNMDVVNIVKEVLGEYSGHGDTTYDINLTRSYPELEYTVQYRESDFTFVTRQLERFGIHYYFVHEDGAHKLVLNDNMDDFPVIDQGTVPFYPIDGQHRPPEEHFWVWHPRRLLTTGAITMTDYNFKTPVSQMLAEQVGDAQYENGQIESFDYPGDYLDRSRGTEVVKLRTLQERSGDHFHAVEGDVVSLNAGCRVTVGGQQVPGILDEEFLCLRVEYSFKSQAYGSGDSGGDQYAYTAKYIMSPVAEPFEPQRTTARPIVHGPQTATVVGEGEIDCDEYGRIWVHFHWDRDKAYSMRCRVSQNWAGKGWGGMIIPRIGMEVVVEFIEGDPDQPLVTGCVYNGKNNAPYALPANKTKSVFKTDTHQGGGFNELTFEDEKDEEKIYMHGQKDQEIHIENDREKRVDNDQFETVGRDKSISVGQDHTETVGRDARHTIGRDVNYKVAQNQIEDYGKDHIHNVGNIHKQAIYADHLISVGRNVEQEVSGKMTVNVVESITTNTGKHTLMAYEKFTIKGPGGSITIGPSGIELKAPKIDLKGMVSMGGSGSAQVPTLSGAANKALPLVEECPKEGE
ncbi:type VI secretion system Vgr family protein [Litoreibacter albidus]|uniref:Type VI secretion system secreted protein VgrG n=1 Tax=Litoreibacter albidus TaxID=670155 RepID=A0A1H3D2X3_9RHOB|nr:type VI secretion system tip protein TssI/VgrG [Litoreibacter albidus]SDX60842.1 type VI secretion system secreted protein VgrG [Litoreibacter albidus]